MPTLTHTAVRLLAFVAPPTLAKPGAHSHRFILAWLTCPSPQTVSHVSVSAKHKHLPGKIKTPPLSQKRENRQRVLNVTHFSQFIPARPRARQNKTRPTPYIQRSQSSAEELCLVVCLTDERLPLLVSCGSAVGDFYSAKLTFTSS